MMKNKKLKDNGTERDKRRIEALPKYRRVAPCEWRSADGYSVYKHFMDNYGPKLVGHTRWEELRGEKTPEEWMTLYEEAFGLLTIENYEDHLKQKVNNNRSVLPRWTQNGTARRNQGYAPEGIKRFGELIENVNKGRADESENKFGVRYRDEWKQVEMELTATGKRKREDAVSSREEKVREVLQIGDGGVAIGYDGLEDYNVMEFIDKRNRKNDVSL